MTECKCKDRHLLLVLAAILLSSAAHAAGTAAVADPVAILPFRCLTPDTSLDWLKIGIAETLNADLRRAGAVSVVERSRVDQAMAAFALQPQNAKLTEEASAAAIGRMVGAKTVLLGTFQKQGEQLRIAARFVLCETGAAAEPVKVSGALQDVLALQDDLSARLFGAPKDKTKRKADPRAFEAYRLYALSLATASDATRVGLLRQSLEVNPDFTYAIDDLFALEKRLRGYAKDADKQLDAKTRSAEQEVFAAATEPQERSRAVLELIGLYMQGLRYAALLAAARRIEQYDLPALGPMDPHEYVSYAAFQALSQLKRYDEALQAGEAHLKRYVGGAYSLSVRMRMQSLLHLRMEQETGRQEAATEFAQIELERSRLLSEPNTRPAQLRVLDFRRCSALFAHKQHRAAVLECGAFAEASKGDPDTQVREFVQLARLHRMYALVEVGAFADARKLAQDLIDKAPEFARRFSLDTLVSTWPRD